MKSLYLKLYKVMRESGQVKSKSASARDKLMKLNKSQFQELATDVYDEMKRRTDEHACIYQFYYYYYYYYYFK